MENKEVLKKQEKLLKEVGTLADKIEEILEDEESLALKLENSYGSKTIKKELEYTKKMQELMPAKGIITVKVDGKEVYKDKEYLWEKKAAAYNKIFSFLKEQGMPGKEQTRFAKILNEYVGLELEFRRG